MLSDDLRVLTFEQYAAACERRGQSIPPHVAKVLQSIEWGPFGPTSAAWFMAYAALAMAESGRGRRAAAGAALTLLRGQ